MKLPTFRELAERFNFGKDYVPQEINVSRILKKDISDMIPKTTPTNPLFVGNANGFKVYKSNHSTEKRDSKERDHGIKNELIIRVLEKALKKGLKENSRTMLVYKNTKGRYDLMVVSKNNNSITIITFIQERKKQPEEYFTPKHKKDNKMILESTETIHIIE